MSLNEPAPDTESEDIRRKIEEQEAVTRSTLWEQMGCPQSKLHMPIDEYMRTFKGRHWFANKTVLAQAQLALRIILCPKCYETIDTKAYLGIQATQFFVTVEDDVMTVFPAVGHFVCHWCGFEEWHPLKHDPRMGTEQHRHTFANQSVQGLGSAIGSPVFGGVLNNGPQQMSQQIQALSQINPALISQQNVVDYLGKALSADIRPDMGPIYGMTEDEKRSLHRLYQRTKKDKPPAIVESRQEAEALAKLPAIERRQFIIQKLRDLGKI